MTDYERLIFNECINPKTSAQIRQSLGMNESTLKNRLNRMVEKSMIKIIQLDNKKHNNGRLYQADLTYQKPIERRTLGICVMGVWF